MRACPVHIGKRCSFTCPTQTEAAFPISGLWPFLPSTMFVDQPRRKQPRLWLIVVGKRHTILQMHSRSAPALPLSHAGQRRRLRRAAVRLFFARILRWRFACSSAHSWISYGRDGFFNLLNLNLMKPVYTKIEPIPKRTMKLEVQIVELR